MALAYTYFAKGQIPSVSRARLLKLYQRTILNQGAARAIVNGNSVEFSGTSNMSVFLRYDKKFAGFADGRLTIEETESEFEVYLEARRPKWKFLFSIYFTKLRNDLEMELQSNPGS